MLTCLAVLCLCVLCWQPYAFAQSGQVINGSRTIYGSLNYGVDAGSTDAYVIALTPPIPNYITGTRYTFRANTANTGAASLNIDARGVTAIKVRAGSVKVDPATNTICAGQLVDVMYDGTDFQMLSQPCTASGGVGDALVANPLSQFASTTSAQLAGVLSDERGTVGGFARIDGTLVIATGKTATISNTVTLSGTDGSTIAFGAGGTLAYTSGNVATATALAVDPTACSAGQFVTDIAANGTLTCATPAGGGNVSNTGTPTANQLATWTSTTIIQGVTTLPTTAVPAFTGDVTNSAGSLATTISAGVVTLAKMANLATATLIGRTTAGTGVPEALTVLPAALEPAHTGDVTNSAGSLVLALVNVPSGTPHAGSALYTAIPATGTPAAGKGSVYVDSTSKNLAVKDDAGVVKHGVQTITCSGQFISAINDAGLPTCTTASGTGTVTSSGTPTSGQLATWTTATNAIGVTALPAANFPALTGDVTTTAASLATTIATGAVTLAKMANIATGSFLGRSTAATGVPEVLSATTALALLSPVGRVRSLYIPAGSMDVTGGCVAVLPAALVTNGPVLPTISCTDADVDSILFDWVMPDGWNAGTITVQLAAFSLGNNTTEILEMDFAGQCVRTGDSPAAHSTTGEQPATITWGASANREQVATTAAITLNGTCAAGAHVYMRGQIDATATTMTPMTDLRILGAKVEYTGAGSD